YLYANDQPTVLSDPTGLFSLHAIWSGVQSEVVGTVVGTAYDVYTLGKDTVNTVSSCSQNWTSYSCEENYQSLGVDVAVELVSTLCGGRLDHPCRAAVAAGGEFLLDRYGYHGGGGGSGGGGWAETGYVEK
ncbi:MAG TPA: hypothetical protein VMU73_06435, partial [Gaiellaceae bacterium]|nr:hypothetical protein [Gaiellaceae bacterium]